MSTLSIVGVVVLMLGIGYPWYVSLITKRNGARTAGALQPAMMRLFAVAESYPELKSNENLLSAQHTYTEVEGHLAASRRAYNAAVKSLNNAAEIFPGSLIASIASVQRWSIASGRNVPTGPKGIVVGDIASTRWLVLATLLCSAIVPGVGGDSLADDKVAAKTVLVQKEMLYSPTMQTGPNTGEFFRGQLLECEIINVSQKVLELRIELVRADGQVYKDTGFRKIPPGRANWETGTQAGGPSNNADKSYCRFSVKSGEKKDVRATAFLFNKEFGFRVMGMPAY